MPIRGPDPTPFDTMAFERMQPDQKTRHLLTHMAKRVTALQDAADALQIKVLELENRQLKAAAKKGSKNG